MAKHSRGILVTGGGTFLGDNIASALLAEGARVSLLVRPGGEDKLGPLGQHTRWSLADVWDPASLRGKARLHSAVIHTVGSLRDDPSAGLSFHRLNFVSARNVANMCVSDGVRRLILISGVSAPWISRGYVQSKRDAEDYLSRLGLELNIIRAPLLYVPGHSRPLFYRLMTVLGALPPLSWFYLGRIAPMPIDTLARGVANVAIAAEDQRRIYYAGDLRRRIKRGAASTASASAAEFLPDGSGADSAFDSLDEDMPFGWTPRDEGH